MYRNFFFLLVGGSLAALILGCGTAPTPTPAPTQPPVVITVIITATPLPPTATPSQPTITPLPTMPPTTLTAATPTTGVVRPTNTPGAPRPAATRTPTRPAVTATATALPLKYAAPTLLRPIWTDNQKDEAKYPGGAIEFVWRAVGGLAEGECYLLQVSTEPVHPGAGGAKGDYWVYCNPEERRADYPVKFVLESPARGGARPSYASILPDTEVWANWSVTVVKNLGQCDPGYEYHCKTAPISPAGHGRFLFKGS